MRATTTVLFLIVIVTGAAAAEPPTGASTPDPQVYPRLATAQTRTDPQALAALEAPGKVFFRDDFESHFDRAVPENAPYYLHTAEGPDDMPAHIKASLMGSSVTIPITAGRLNLGTWQGIYLCEHRDRGGSRRIVVTAVG